MYQPNIESAAKYVPAIVDLTQNPIQRQYPHPDFQNNLSYYTWNNTLANTHTYTTNSSDYIHQRYQMNPTWNLNHCSNLQFGYDLEPGNISSSQTIFHTCLGMNAIRFPAVNSRAYQRSQQLPLNPPVFNNTPTTYGDPSIIRNHSDAELPNWGLMEQSDSPSDTSGIGSNSNDTDNSSNANPSDSPTLRTPPRHPSPVVSPMVSPAVSPTAAHPNAPDNSLCKTFCKYCHGGDQQKYENQRHRQRMMFKKKIFREKFAYYKRKFKLLGRQ